MNTKNEIISTKIKTDIIYYFRKNVEEITIQDNTEHIQRFNCQANLDNGWILSGTCSDISGYLDFEIAIIPNYDCLPTDNLLSSEKLEDIYPWLNVENIDIHNVDMNIVASNPSFGHTSSKQHCNIEDIDAFFELVKALPDPYIFKTWKDNYQKINKAIWQNTLNI